jgi:hypothetical protein
MNVMMTILLCDSFHGIIELLRTFCGRSYHSAQLIYDAALRYWFSVIKASLRVHRDEQRVTGRAKDADMI